MNGVNGNAQSPPQSPRYTLLTAAFAVWAVWWLAAGQSYPDYVAFVIWVAALALFGAAFYRPWPLTRPDAFTAVVAVTVAAAVLPRILGAEFAPYEVALDEAIHPLLGREVLEREPWRVFDGVAEHFATPYLDLVLQALLPGLRGARQMSALLSAISLLATYALARRLCDRGTAFFAVLVLGCAYWHIAFARTGYPFMQPIALVPLGLWVLVSAEQEDSDFLRFAGGVLLGMSVLLYTPARIIVPIFAAWWILGVVAGRFRWRTCVPILLGCAVFLSPHLHRQEAATLLSRFRAAANIETTPIGAAGAQGVLSAATVQAFAAQAEIAARAYVSDGGWMAPHSVAPGPLLDRGTIVLTLAGLLLALMRLRRSASLLLLIWVAAVFIGGQVLTDVPQAAYRAGPVLPALAIAAGSAVEWLAALLARVAGRSGAVIRGALAIAVVACIAPPNRALFSDFLEARANHPGGGIARLIAGGDARLTYFVVDIAPNLADPRFQILTTGKDARDVDSLSDLLGERLADAVGRPTRSAVIILGPPLRTAEQAIRRCYPGAVPLSMPHWRAASPPLALQLQPQAIAGGRACLLKADDQQGLRATYYADDSFEGDIVRTAIDDWPLRWVGDHPADFGSVEWRGFLNVPIAGTYKLQLMSTSAGSTAQIGKQTLLQAGEIATVPLAARAYPLVLRYRAARQTRYALYWVPPGGEGEVIPPGLLSPYPRNRSDRRWLE